MRGSRLLVGLVAAACGLALVGCGEASGTAGDLRAIAAEAGVRDADVPPRDARLAPTTWPQAAAWMAREAEGGRPVVLNLYGSWCEPCKQEAPLLRAAMDAHPGITFLLVDTRDGRVPGEAFLVEHGFEDVPSLFDPEALVYEGLGGRGMPTTWFFAPPGVLVGQITGLLTASALAEQLALLEPDAH